MSIEQLFMLGQLLVLAGGAVWAVSKIRSTTEVLGVQITHLANAVDDFKNAVSTMQRDYVLVRERLAVVEQIHNHSTVREYGHG
jgi:hypothetical protein